MRLAIISHKGIWRELVGVFRAHPDFEGEIACLIDCNLAPSTREERDCEGIPIFSSLEDCVEQALYDTVFIAVPWPGRANKLLLRLHDGGFKNVFLFHPHWIQAHAPFLDGKGFRPEAVRRMPEAGDKPYLTFLETHACDRCNLNCKACTHFAPFAAGSGGIVDLPQYARDLQELSRLFSGIGRISVLGGEPLLEPELSLEMLRLSRAAFPEADLELTTNGLLVPKMAPDFWQGLRETNAIVNVTVYPPTQKILNRIEETFERFSVRVDPAFRTERVSGFVRLLTDGREEDAAYNDEMCSASGCHQLQRGYLGKCPVAMYSDLAAESLHRKPEEVKTKDAVCLASAEDGWSVLRKLNAPCDWCWQCSKKRQEVIPWEQAGRAASWKEWLIQG